MWRRIPHCDEPLFFATCCEMSFQQKYRNIKSRGMRPYKHEHYPINVNFCYVVFRISELLIIKHYQALQYSATGRGIQFLPSTQKQSSGISLRKIFPLDTPPYSHFSRLVGNFPTCGDTVFYGSPEPFLLCEEWPALQNWTVRGNLYHDNIIYLPRGPLGRYVSRRTLCERGLVLMITYSDLFQFVIMLCAVITLVIHFIRKKQRPRSGKVRRYFL